MRAAIRPLAILAVMATMALASVVGGTEAMADSATVPGAPTITSVSTGGVAGQLLVAYSPPTTAGSSPITSYQATVDGGANWLTCSNGTSGTCPLVNLPVGRQFTIQLRAVNSVGAGTASVPSTGTAEGPDPDNPGAIAGSKVIVKATFSAAANGLGVNPATAALGVGTLPKLTFSTAILDKAVVEKHLKVTATDVAGGVHAVPGAWGWL
ncbi:MAG: fibronectin type III domain-containing protein, partial [Candidatus Nanopelagicales bacterium]|nr:fibronectin type III domain-containing protein [Candidatus Nanopelagicales bacterium]